MIQKKLIDEITKTIQNALPQELIAATSDIQLTLKAVVQEQFQEWQLITRDEFDLQQHVLARTREKVEKLEKIISDLESSLADKTHP